MHKLALYHGQNIISGHGRGGLDFAKTRSWKAAARIVRAARRTMQTMAGTKRCGETRLTRWIQLHYELDYHLNGNKREMLKYTDDSSASGQPTCAAAPLQHARKCATSSRVLDHRYANGVARVRVHARVQPSPPITHPTPCNPSSSSVSSLKTISPKREFCLPWNRDFKKWFVRIIPFDPNGINFTPLISKPPSDRWLLYLDREIRP